MAGARILLCEDHETLRAIAARVLRADGHEVVDVASAAEAIELLSAERFDVLVLDLHLGEESGLTVLERAPVRPPVLLVCGDFDPRNGGRDAARYGVEAALAKPFDADELCGAVRTLLEGATPRR